MQKHFKITSIEVENLQKTVKKVKEQGANGEFEIYEFFLTESGEPLDLLCNYFDLWTYEDFYYNNTHYYDEILQSYIDKIDFGKIYLQTIDNEKKLLYIDNIELYKKDLQEFTEKFKKELDCGYGFGFKKQLSCDNDIVDIEYNKIVDEVSDYMYNTYINGENGEPGILKTISNFLAKQGFDFEYDEKTGDITLFLSDDYCYINNIEDEDFKKIEIETIKQDFLYDCKYEIILNLQKKQNKFEQQKEQRQKKQERQKKQDEIEKNKIIEKIKKSIVA